MGRRVEAERDAARRDQAEGEAREQGGAAQRLADQRRGGAVHHDRHAEVAVQHGVEPAPVLQRQRIVEAKLGLELRDGGGCRELAQDRVGDVARQDMDDAEDQHRHAQEHAEQAQKTPQQEGGQPHGLSPPLDPGLSHVALSVVSTGAPLDFARE